MDRFDGHKHDGAHCDHGDHGEHDREQAVGGDKSTDLIVAQTSGGPGISSEVPAKYVYDYMFQGQNLGQGFAASTMMLLAGTSLAVTIWVFIGIGAAVQGFENASRTIVLEFGDRQNLPVRIALANSVSQVAGSVGPLAGGALATVLGYEWVFLASVVFLAAGASLILLRIPEPRQRL